MEYRRFVEFCDACRRERYIGLCFGAPGIGKTLSAVHYSGNELLPPRFSSATGTAEPEPTDTVFYTTGVINTPSRIDIEVRRAEILLSRATRAIRTEAREALDKLDHLVPLELGGAGRTRKHVAPMRAGRKRSKSRYFKRKDAVENYLVAKVRSGAMPLEEAQRGIATDWTQYHNAR